MEKKSDVSGRGISRNDPRQSQEEDMLSLRDAIRMVVRHWKKIAVFVGVVTGVAGLVFFLGPREYRSEGFLQVVPPLAKDEKVDKELFETQIVSHLQKAAAAYISDRVAAQLNKNGGSVTSLELRRHVKIMRPPKSDLIRVEADGCVEKQAMAIVKLWIGQYLESLQQNNMAVALSQARTLLKEAQSGVIEKQGAVDQLKAAAEKTDQLLTISKSVDDQQLWKDLADNKSPDALKQLSQIHIKGQEESKEYVMLKSTLTSVNQSLASALAKRKFYAEVVRLLESKAPIDFVSLSKKEGEVPSDAVQYLKNLLGNNDIVQVGEPALVSDSRGAVKKTSLVFLMALMLACLTAFTTEWFRAE